MFNGERLIGSYSSAAAAIWEHLAQNVFPKDIRLFPLGHYRYLNYLYARHMVMARSFLVHGIDKDPVCDILYVQLSRVDCYSKVRVLLPFYDMFNHAFRADGGATVMFAGGEMRIVLSKEIQVFRIKHSRERLLRCD